jgi:hypothetical protein
MGDLCDKENPQGSFQGNQIRDQQKITVFHIKSKGCRRVGHQRWDSSAIKY